MRACKIARKKCRLFMNIQDVWAKTVIKYFGEFTINPEFKNFRIDSLNKKIFYFGDNKGLAKSIVPNKYLDIGKRYA